jgi:hypothetical protein
MGVSVMAESNLPSFEATLERWREARDGLLGVLDLYSQNGPWLIEDVIEGLVDATDPSRELSTRAVLAAGKMQAELRTFLQLRASATMALADLTLATEQLSLTLALRLWDRATTVNSTGAVPNHLALSSYIRHFKSQLDSGYAEFEPILNFAVAQMADVLSAVEDLVAQRLLLMLNFLKSIEAPEEVVGEKGTYRIETIASSTFTETLFEGATEAAKRLPIEVAGQVPILSALASLLRLTIDVREKLEAIDERRALWQKIWSLKMGRGISDEILDSLDWINEDDVLLRSLSNKISEIATQLTFVSSEFAMA